MQNAESLSRDQIQEFLRVERANRVQQRWAARALRVGGARAGGAEVLRVGETGTRPGAGLRAESDRVERGAEHAIDPGVSGSRRGARPVVPTAPVRVEIYGRRHCLVGGSGSGAWAVERAGHAADFA